MSVHEDEHNDIPIHDPRRPHSFDLTLELERQLDNESLPNSPAHDRHHSLDSHVLASIVTTLRMGMAELTKERDELAAALEASRQKEHDLGDAVDRLSEKHDGMHDELEALRKKSKEDDDSIVMLRSKVEESRRGLMRLQTESRRMSRGPEMSVDLSRAGSFSFGGPPSSSKRASFAPLTGNSIRASHRRISSVSDSNTQWSEAIHPPITEVDHSPTGQTIALPDVQQTSYPPTQSRRFSGLFGRPAAETDFAPAGLAAVEVEALQREVKSLKSTLEETRHELTEALEAREASDTCVKALRDFIGEHAVGTAPAVATVERASEPERKGSVGATGAPSRWGFGGLWRKEEGTKDTPSPASSPIVTRPPPPPPAEPLTKKLGGFFSTRGSVSSLGSTPPRAAPPVQEPMYNGSDTSSSTESQTEPVSPVSEQLPAISHIESSLAVPREVFNKAGAGAVNGIKVVL
ncbi:hypothetical protein FA95DRAFT_1606256 [Auriscalpium vulgare]|uniref:Uncharacterized protein n=1 Tax=Auriscalpium vulgare TaxID=40419 RepID=A0ACB8RTE4_9AGAM|nr:hypothetical protein FA95DRAFT_1606256 [Auriscalpium vulgare]